ncbi:hypothetical protein Tco_1003952 [Tanacetum coccineum]|uniref:Uncharacterized protein n=1 Tax=Tanacetum coccineum TaxID=301880 RepID=A0ABQ5FB64_9ASTR
MSPSGFIEVHQLPVKLDHLQEQGKRRLPPEENHYPRRSEESVRRGTTWHPSKPSVVLRTMRHITIIVHRNYEDRDFSIVSSNYIQQSHELVVVDG